jgi:hypothetical protein
VVVSVTTFNEQDIWTQLCFFQQNGASLHTVGVIFDALHDVFGASVLWNRFPERFGCGWSWPSRSPDLNPCDCFLCGCHKDRVYCTGAASGNWSCCWRDHRWRATWHSWQLVVRLQRVHEVKGSHIEHVFTWRPHTHKLSMKMSINSCIMLLYPRKLRIYRCVAFFSEYSISLILCRILL